MNEILIEDKYKINPDKWIIKEKRTISSSKKYSLAIVLFILGLVFVSIIKNEARILQKEINNLQTSIYNLKVDLHEAGLDHEILTSPEHISKLAEKYLDSDFSYYEASQIMQLNQGTKPLKEFKQATHKKKFKKKSKEFSKEIKFQVAQKIEKNKAELKKLHKLYSHPEELPRAIKSKIAENIRVKKNKLKKLYSLPKDSIESEKAQRWVMVQIVKAFLGIPTIPGK